MVLCHYNCAALGRGANVTCFVIGDGSALPLIDG
jgi:hypothetical protein